MGRDPAEQTTPDLFSTATVRDAPAQTKSPAAKATTKTAPRRHVLPNDLPNAVKHLSDSELDLIHAATLEEMKRRGRMPQGVETDLQTLRHRFDARPDLIKKKSTATGKRTIVETGGSFDSRSGECRSGCVQGGDHAITDCTTIRFVSIERLEVVEIR